MKPNAGVTFLIPVPRGTQSPQGEEEVRRVLLRVLRYFESLKESWECIVYNPDSASRYLESHLASIETLHPALQLRFSSEGSGFEAAVKRARFERVVHIPAYEGYPVKESQLLLEALAEGSDIAWGSRFLRDESIVQKSSDRFFLAMERVSAWLGNLAARFQPHDPLSGFVAFKSLVIKQIEESKTLTGVRSLGRAARLLKLEMSNVGIMWIPTKPHDYRVFERFKEALCAS